MTLFEYAGSEMRGHIDGLFLEDRNRTVIEENKDSDEYGGFVIGGIDSDGVLPRIDWEVSAYASGAEDAPKQGNSVRVRASAYHIAYVQRIEEEIQNYVESMILPFIFVWTRDSHDLLRAHANSMGYLMPSVHYEAVPCATSADSLSENEDDCGLPMSLAAV